MHKVRYIIICLPALLVALVLMVPMAHASAVQDTLDSYRAAGAGPFDAARGETMWTQVNIHAETGQKRDCTTCHTPDLTATGKHKKTGKLIKPLAPSANPERLTETKKIKKWFKRNCKWTLGRLCTPQEKGDFLLYIQSK